MSVEPTYTEEDMQNQALAAFGMGCDAAYATLGVPELARDKELSLLREVAQGDSTLRPGRAELAQGGRADWLARYSYQDLLSADRDLAYQILIAFGRAEIRLLRDQLPRGEEPAA